MTDYLKRAYKYLDVDPDKVVKSREEADEVIVLVDYGIGGIKKYHVAYALLTEPIAKPKPVQEINYDFLQEPDEAIDYDSFTVAELRNLAKEGGISYAGLNKSDLIDALEGGDK